MDPIARPSLVEDIKKIQDGDQVALEELIEEYKPFIKKTAVHFCKRMLVWGQDDELSIGLMAFDSAVRTYDPGKEIPFQAYCRVVIVNRLKDYARNQFKYQTLVQLGDEDVNTYFEGQVAQQDYLKRCIEEERREELECLEEMLSAFSIGFEDLVDVSPKHRDSRQTLLQVARHLAQTEELWDLLTSRKHLPLNELEKACGVKRRTLERGRKFIIASAVLLYNVDQFIHLNSYIDFS